MPNDGLCQDFAERTLASLILYGFPDNASKMSWFLRDWASELFIPILAKTVLLNESAKSDIRMQRHRPHRVR
jgi:hypothetical protein